MPTYDYACDHCGHEFEQFQSISARSLRKCPECGRKALQRLIGAGAGIIFKGSGFHQTDYRSESYKKAAEAEKKAQSSTGDKADKKDTGGKMDTGTKTSGTDKGVSKPKDEGKVG